MKLTSAVLSQPRYINGAWECRINVTFDRECTRKGLVHTGYVAPDGVLYVGTSPDSDTVDFIFHAPRNEAGFGGSTRELRMADGSVQHIRGGWSSRAGCVHAIVPGLQTVEVCGPLSVVYHVTRASLEKFGIMCEAEDLYGETYYQPVFEKPNRTPIYDRSSMIGR